MRDELILHGILPPTSSGSNIRAPAYTHEQAADVHAMLSKEDGQAPLLVISSGYHLYRGVLTSRQARLTAMNGLNAANVGTEADPGWFA